MKLNEFKFDLPKDLIARYPLEHRDESRLMVFHRDSGKIEHRKFNDLLEYFSAEDVLIFNDTKVFPAKLRGNKEKTGADIEVFLLRELDKNDYLWDALVDPARKIRVGNKLYFGDNSSLVAEVIDNTTSRGRTIKFHFDGEYSEFWDYINELGETPIPPLLNRASEERDIDRFQTIYAKNVGAVTAPTAGLHFTPQILKRLEIAGINISYVTLHIGLDAFKSVEVEDLTKHKKYSEHFEIRDETVQTVNRAINSKRRICSIGTSTLKAVESSVSSENQLKPDKGWTDKFIFPPYDNKICNALLSNFHLPQSTLFMVSCAFGGYDNVMKLYRTAIKEKYRFYTYGDALLIL